MTTIAPVTPMTTVTTVTTVTVGARHDDNRCRFYIDRRGRIGAISPVANWCHHTARHKGCQATQRQQTG